MEAAFIAHHTCGTPIPNDQYLLGLNEVNWIIHEVTTVLYSYMKAEVIIRNEKIKKVVKAVMFLIFLAFSACRINIGALRVFYSVTGNAAISQAHSYAFICWGLADLIVLGLLISNALSLQKTSNVASKQTITVLLTSSIPRIAIIIINTLVIVVIGNIPEPNATTKNMNTLCWMIKGVYPFVLLIDILMTKESLTNIRDNHSQQKSKSVADKGKMGSIHTSAIDRTSSV